MSKLDIIIHGREQSCLKESRRVEDHYVSSISVCCDPKWNPENHVIISLWRRHEYHNILLDQAGAEELIAALQKQFNLKG